MAYEVLTDDSSDGEVGVLKITRELVNFKYELWRAGDLAHAKRIYMAACETNPDPTRITFVLVKVR